MKKLTSILMAFLFIILFFSTASATLIKVGTATYGYVDYNLIWDNSNDGVSVIWFDYTSPSLLQNNQKLWANSLNENLTINIDSAYQVNFTTGWHLPAYPSETNLSDENLDVFQHLYSTYYWSQTSFNNGSGAAFNPVTDFAGFYVSNTVTLPGMALAGAMVAPVPIPGAVWLLGSGLFGLICWRRRQRK